MKSLILKYVTIIFLITALFSASTDCIAMRAVPDDLIVQSVLITLDDKKGRGGGGSGFYFNENNEAIYLISAFHVFFEKDRTKQVSLKASKAHLLSYSKNLDWSKPVKFNLNLQILMDNGSIRYDIQNDIIVIQVAKISDESANQMRVNDGIEKLTNTNVLTVPRENIKFYKEVLVGNDVYITGFPSSIGIKKIEQIDYNRPLLRKGIIAGKNDNRKTITIDCATYGGNSGGPVIELERIKLGTFNVRVIGIIIQFVPFVEKWINPQYKLANIEFENSGYTIVAPMDGILNIIKEF